MIEASVWGRSTAARSKRQRPPSKGGPCGTPGPSLRDLLPKVDPVGLQVQASETSFQRWTLWDSRSKPQRPPSKGGPCGTPGPSLRDLLPKVDSSGSPGPSLRDLLPKVDPVGLQVQASETSFQRWTPLGVQVQASETSFQRWILWDSRSKPQRPPSKSH
uniref:Uncharacterized protein n=1 Tax=Knipowitschia caucasica TaxID=637954 RepID=A0AAV2LF29_KNICA